MNAITPHEDQKPASRAVVEVINSVPILDTGMFEHMQRIASAIVASQTLPDSLRIGKDKNALPKEEQFAKALLLVNQSVRWGLDPFAVAQSAAVVHGRLCYEGKLVAAVIDAKAGIKLDHVITGEGDSMRIYLSDVRFTEDDIKILHPDIKIIGKRIITGTVGQWKTTGQGSPWSPNNYRRQLVYRGTREWARLYESALLLGVYTADEMVAMSDNAAANRSHDVTPAPSPLAQRLQQAKASSQPTRHVIEHTMAEIDGPIAGGETDHDAVTGEIIEDDTAEGHQEPQGAPQGDDVFPGDLPSGQTTEAPQQSPILFSIAREYAAALYRCASLETLEAGHDAFFVNAGIDAPDVTSTDTLWGKIYASHKSRIEAGKPRETVEKWINVAFAEAGEVL